MSARQEIFRVRRNYNQWVNNQTLEDYALRFTAKSARKWSLARVANTALGAISFLALEAIGGALTLSYGFNNAALSILIISLIIFLAGLPICYYAAKYGVDIDLLTRGAGFGYIGSTITSLIYASFTFIFFALEAAIMAMALKLMLNIPLSIGYIICSIAVIPLVTHGITLISRFQLWTQPFWIILQTLPFCFILYHDASSVTNWLAFENSVSVESVEKNQKISLIYFGAAAAVLFSLIAQIGEQVDFLRFLPPKTSKNRIRWWLALVTAGPGWIIIGAIKLFAGSFLAVLAINNGINPDEAADPARMYIVAFSYMTHSPDIALVIGGLFVILSQLKINVTNAYAGSIAWSNFFSRLTHSHPGRVVWLVFNVVIALMLMELGIYQAFEETLGVYAIVAVAWVATLVADLVINKPLGLSPKHIEFKRAYLYDINPVGVGAMLLSSAAGVICYLGVFGITLQALAHFIAIIVALSTAPLIAYITGGKYYIAREPALIINDDQVKAYASTIECVICQNMYELEDMAMCPAYNGGICSLCCSLDARCHDSCKEDPSFIEQAAKTITQLLPKRLGTSFNHYFTQFTFLVVLVTTIIGCLLALIYVNGITGDQTVNALLSETLWKVFFILTIVAGVIAWLFVLAHKSRKVAEEESQHQNQLLMEEIQAHKKTDAALQLAKEHADAANSAKSRYVTGISHELRTPLNSILGYTQLLQRNTDISEKNLAQLTVIRNSGEHLADLIEGLLDISKIEAGRLDLHKDKIDFAALMDQFDSMFRLQAENKYLDFTYTCLSKLPKFITTDEKRIRQILINLLSNAIKFTQTGQVTLELSYRNEVAKFIITDTGTGIPESEISRIFKPFERIRNSNMPNVSGTGLGLTITKLLIDIMGGDLNLENNQFGGLTVTVSMMLPRVLDGQINLPRKVISGYQGTLKTITVVDDDPNHRGLISDYLNSLGFTVLEAHDATSCLEMHGSNQPDMYLLDISMPGMSGWQLAKELRVQGYKQTIMMVSASSGERNSTKFEEGHANDYIVKPVKFEELTTKLSEHLALQWNHQPAPVKQSLPIKKFNYRNNNVPDAPVTTELLTLIKVGHLSGFNDLLDQLSIDQPALNDFISYMRLLIQNVELNLIKTGLQTILNNAEEAPNSITNNGELP